MSEWVPADSLSSVRGFRRRHQKVTQLVALAGVVASRIDVFERGVAVGAAGMSGSPAPDVDRVSGSSSGGSYAERQAVDGASDDALDALRKAERLIDDALRALQSTVFVMGEWAALGSVAADRSICPGDACEIVWHGLGMVWPVHVLSYSLNGRLDPPVRISEPMYNFCRRHDRLPTRDEVQGWWENGQKWPAKGKRKR